jgi:hypothetical protein
MLLQYAWNYGLPNGSSSSTALMYYSVFVLLDCQRVVGFRYWSLFRGLGILLRVRRFRSTFAAVKCTSKLSRGLLAIGFLHQSLMASSNPFVISSSCNPGRTAVSSLMGSVVFANKIHVRIWWYNASMGELMSHYLLISVRFRSKSSSVTMPYVVSRCCRNWSVVTVANPSSGSFNF